MNLTTKKNGKEWVAKLTYKCSHVNLVLNIEQYNLNSHSKCKIHAITKLHSINKLGFLISNLIVVAGFLFYENNNLNIKYTYAMSNGLQMSLLDDQKKTEFIV